MTRVRLRPAMSAADLAVVYERPHRHDQWDDHRLRVAVTVQVAGWLMRDRSVYSVADLSCGDASVVRGLSSTGPRYLGDLAPGWPIAGPIEQTIDRIPPVDLFVCSETVEHLDDPDTVLAQIRGRAGRLVLSTPVDETVEVDNPEHYWSWGVDDVRTMLDAAGWEPVVHTTIRLRPTWTYDYQVWGCQ